MRFWFVVILGLLLSISFSQSHRKNHVCYIVLRNVVINPALKDFLQRSINSAQEDKAECLVVQLTTPGGMIDAMQDIVQLFLNSPVPIVTFVAPRGGNADSAGTFLVMAGHIAAMAPASRIGAAHPIIITPSGGEEGKGPSQSEQVLMEKVTNAVVGTIKAIAEERQRNIKWAEKMVRESAVLTAREAYEQKVIDIIADDLQDLLKKINKRQIRTVDGVKLLHTSSPEIHDISMSAKETFLHFLSNPNIAYLLLLIAMFGFLLEIYNPGAVLPITVGIIAFLLFLYSSTMLPVNIVGVLLILAAAAFFVSELFITTHGVLAGAGVIALLVGGYMLFPSEGKLPNFYVSYFRVTTQTLVGAGITVGGLLTAGIVAIVRGQMRKPEVGKEWLIGKIGEARTDLSPNGTVYVGGTWWTAESNENIKAGEKVEVIMIDGLTLKVKRRS